MLSLWVISACGPPSIGSSGGETTGSGDTQTHGDAESSESSEEVDPETSSEDGGEGWFMPDDDGAKQPCNIVLQDCLEGEKCVPSSGGGGWDELVCVPVLGDKLPGEPCTYGTVAGTDDCDETGACWNVMNIDGELIGTCTAFCTGSPDAPECPAGSLCALSGQSDVAFCLPQCDPIGQDCGAGLGCYWAVSYFGCIFTTQDIPAGEPCGYINDCAAGHGCVEGRLIPDCAGLACCAAFCDINLGDAQCESVPGTGCVPFFAEDTAPPNYEHVGVCILP